VHAGRQRRVALHELEVLGDQEDEAEEAEERHRDRDRTAGEAGILKTRTSSSGFSVRNSSSVNAVSRTAAAAKQASVAGRRPAPLRPLDDGEHQQGHPAVEMSTPGTSKRWRHSGGRRGISIWPAINVMITMGTLTRKIDPYQKCSRSAPPGDRAEGHGDPRRGAPDAERLLALGGSVKMLVRMARLAGKMKAAATPMRARAAIRVPVVCAGRGGRREEPEEDQAHLHGALAAEPVADAAAGQQQAGEGQAVGVDDPLQRGDGGAQVAVQRGQGHVDDGVVHHHQEDREAQDGRINQRRRGCEMFRYGQVRHRHRSEPSTLSIPYRTLCQL
jgi:hypothetical protein